MTIKLALFSVYDKTGITDFSRKLTSLGIQIVATSGTLAFLNTNGVNFVKHVSEITQFPEILNGRVKTEHPKLMGGILAVRNNKSHMHDLKRLGIKRIDMVVCNLSPIDKTINGDHDLQIFLQHIDIGGPNIIKAAIKNFENVVLIVNPKRYNSIYQELETKGDICMKTRVKLVLEALKETKRYDDLIYASLKQKLIGI